MTITEFFDKKNEIVSKFKSVSPSLVKMDAQGRESIVNISINGVWTLDIRKVVEKEKGVEKLTVQKLCKLNKKTFINYSSSAYNSAKAVNNITEMNNITSVRKCIESEVSKYCETNFGELKKLQNEWYDLWDQYKFVSRSTVHSEPKDDSMSNMNGVMSFNLDAIVLEPVVVTEPVVTIPVVTVDDKYINLVNRMAALDAMDI